jgi:translation initiation factor IF-3
LQRLLRAAPLRGRSALRAATSELYIWVGIAAFIVPGRLAVIILSLLSLVNTPPPLLMWSLLHASAPMHSLIFVFVPTAGQQRGYRKQRPRQLVDDAITSDVVQLVSLEGRNLGHVALADAKLLAKQKGLRVACVVPLANPPVCRLQRIEVVPDIDDDAFDDENDDGTSVVDLPPKDDASSSSSGGAPVKRRPKGEKELRFSDSIADHDVQNKVNQLRRFLDKGLRVRVSVFFKSVGRFDPDLARMLLDNIASHAEDLARVDGDVHFANRFASFLLVPNPRPATTTTTESKGSESKSKQDK